MYIRYLYNILKQYTNMWSIYYNKYHTDSFILLHYY